ncbi:hypothetical protein HK405_000545 [Cladochytrium tenue]|nr:hypothetical protein HK405_000545 [Cladochytrium tenue]
MQLPIAIAAVEPAEKTKPASVARAAAASGTSDGGNDGGGGTGGWVLVELQGRIHVVCDGAGAGGGADPKAAVATNAGAGGAAAAGDAEVDVAALAAAGIADLGCIRWTGEGKSARPVLEIGRHQLVGRRVELPQPLAVLRTTMATDGVEGGEPAKTHAIVALVRHKLVFADRPAPVLSSENVGLTAVRRR